MNTRISLVEYNICKMNVDVIVNAANEKMLGGGGVDGAIHKAAGPGLYNACKQFPEENGIRVPTGNVRITPAFDLPSKFIIHTAGPIWQGGNNNEAELLESCYSNSLVLAALHGKSVAFPAISTGVYGYPLADACAIAYNAATDYFNSNPNTNLEKVYFVTFLSPATTNAFQKYLTLESF